MDCGRSAAVGGYGVAQRRHRVLLMAAAAVVVVAVMDANVIMVHSWTISSSHAPITRAAFAAAALKRQSPSPWRSSTSRSTLFRTTAAAFNSMPLLNSSRRRSWKSLPPLRLSETDATESSTESTTTGTPSLATIYTLDGVELNGPLSAVSNRIVVKVRDTLTATSGGILLPDQSQQRPTEGYVLVSGPGRVHPHSAVRIPNPIEPGMSVV
jgi:chaperonin GroES